MWSAGVQREMPLGFVIDVTYVGRRGRNLQRELNINQLPAGTVQANPGVNSAALRPYKGYGVIRRVGERRPLEVQQPAGQRRPPLQERLQVRPRLHARPLGGQRERQARRALQRLRRFRLLGQLELRSPPRVQLLLHLRPAVLQGAERAGRRSAGRLADHRLDVHAHRHAAVGDAQATTSPASATPSRSRGTWSAIRRRTRTSSSRNGAAADQNYWFNPNAYVAAGRRHVQHQRAAEQHLQPRPVPVGHRAVQERERRGDEVQRSSAPRSSTS